MKKIKKAKKAKKIKTKKLVTVAPKKRGRPRKEKATVAPKKRGRPKKVVETKRDKLQKVAKLGKRKFKQAVEEMAMEKINKKMRRKKNGNGNGNAYSETVSSRVYSYEKYSPISAGPNVLPVGIDGSSGKNKPVEENSTVPVLDRVKSRLIEKGYKWKENTFKVVEKSPTSLTVEFTDKKQGKVTSYNVVENVKKEMETMEEIKNGKPKKMLKLSKVELNHYVKKLKTRGLHPTNIKVIENTPEYFKIEFNDGDNGSVVTCGHVKGWDV